MVLRPEDIEQREFGSALRGFDKAEVRAFLRRVAGEVRYLEAEVDAVRGESSVTPDEPAPSLELPTVESRPAPPILPPEPPEVDLAPRDLPDLGAPGSQLPEPVIEAEPAPVPVPEALAGRVDTPETDADRFGALGERIASLLRNAQETAEQVRHQADSEAAQTRAEAAAAGVELRSSADQYASQTRAEAAAAAEELRGSAENYSVEVRTAADTDAAAIRASADEALSSAQAEAAEIREHALADANEMRELAARELDSARAEASSTLSHAETEAALLRRQAIDEGRASLSDREASVAQQEAAVAGAREQALAELADARGQVSSLLQEARAQSEFIRQESEEIIRTKVRANMEQAQRRIDMLRTTETASKDRISAARKELESALARLDAEPAPGLPEGTEDLVLEEAQRAVVDAEIPQSDHGDDTAPQFDGPIDADIIDVPMADESTFDDTTIEDAGFYDATSVKPDITEPQWVDVDETFDPVDERIGDQADLGDTDLAGGDDLGMTENVTDVIPPTVEDDDEFIDPGVGQTVHGGSFFAPRPDTEISPPPPPPGFDAPRGIDAPVFDAPVFDAPVFEAPADTPTFEPAAEPAAEADPLEGLIPGESVDATSSASTDEPSVGEHDQVVFGDPQTTEPAESVSDINTPENEDALAKLVREAMQRAVDSARGNQT